MLNVDGPLSITVQGVQVIPGSHAIGLPGNGYGYRTTGEKTVKRDEDYTFTLTFVDGFKAGSNFKVVAQQILSQDLIDNGYTPEEIQLTGKDGTYTIPTVQKDYRIIVSGVEAVSRGITATVNFTITEGHYQAWITGDNERNIPPRGESGIQMKRRVLEAFADLPDDTCIITHGGVIAAIMEHLFPDEGMNRYQWQPKPGGGYAISDDMYYSKL